MIFKFFSKNFLEILIAIVGIAFFFGLELKSANGVKYSGFIPGIFLLILASVAIYSNYKNDSNVK